MTSLISRINAQIDKIVLENEGTVIEGYQSPNKPIVLTCKNEHTFGRTIQELRSGQWCDKCVENFSYDTLETVIKELELHYNAHTSIEEIPNVIFDYLITGSDIKCLLDVDKLEDLKKEEKRNEVRNKIKLCENDNLKLIRIDDSIVHDKDKLDEFLFDAFTGDKLLYIYNIVDYSWINENNVGSNVQFNQTIDQSAEKINTPSTNYEKNSETSTLNKVVSTKEKRAYIDELLKVHKIVALAYCRVSSQYQVKDGVSLESQEFQIREYAKTKNMPVGWVFKDEGISGREMYNRPALNEMLELVGPRIQVIVISISRLSRNLEQRIQISKKIDEMKGSLMILDLQIDTSSAIGSMLLNLMSNVAEYESRASGERISSNMLYLSKQGRLRGKPPFGWRFIAKKVPFEREESEQKTIEYIRKIVDENPDLHLSGICKILNKEGYKCRRAKFWRSDRLRVIMEQNQIPVIIGEMSTV